MQLRHLSTLQVARITALLEEGFSMRYIAQRVDVSVSVMSRAWERYQKTGHYARRKGSGRRRITTIRQDRHLVRLILQRRIITARNVCNKINLYNISEETIRNRLREVGLASHPCAQVPRLTLAHRHARLQFACNHKLDCEAMKKCVFFGEVAFLSLRQ